VVINDDMMVLVTQLLINPLEKNYCFIVFRDKIVSLYLLSREREIALFNNWRRDNPKKNFSIVQFELYLDNFANTCLQANCFDEEGYIMLSSKSIKKLDFKPYKTNLGFAIHTHGKLKIKTEHKSYKMSHHYFDNCHEIYDFCTEYTLY